MAAEVRATVEPGRHVHLVLEHDGNVADHLRRGFDAQWNDDAHHVLHVLLTGEADGYYADYAERPAERLARCLGEGFAYQGEPSAYRKGERAWHAQRRSAAHRLRAVPAEPRPGRQPAVRRPAGRARRSRDARGRDRPAAPLPADPADLHGRGGGEPHALPVLHRPSRRAREGGARRPAARVRGLRGLPRRRDGRIDSRSQRAGDLREQPSRRRRRGQAARCTASCWRCAPLPWCRILPARGRFRREAGGPACVAARWRLGNGAVLALVSNLGRTDCAVDPSKGDLLFESARRRQRRRSRRPARQGPPPSPSWILPPRAADERGSGPGPRPRVGVAVDWTDAMGRPQRVRTELLRAVLLEALRRRRSARSASPPLLTGAPRPADRDRAASMATIRPSWRWRTAR